MTPQEHVSVLVRVLHHEFGMGESEVIELVTETAYDYFDNLHKFTRLVEYTEELGLYSDQETPKQE